MLRVEERGGRREGEDWCEGGGGDWCEGRGRGLV